MSVDVSDHCSYEHYLSSSENKAYKIQTIVGVEPMTFHYCSSSVHPVNIFIKNQHCHPQ